MRARCAKVNQLHINEPNVQVGITMADERVVKFYVGVNEAVFM
jgi:hypothetical protein